MYSIDSLGFYDLTVRSKYEIADKNTDNTITAGYWTLNTSEPNGTTSIGSNITIQSSTINRPIIQEVDFTPYSIKFHGITDTSKVTIIAHVPTMQSITITDIAIWDSDTLKRIHLSVPLSVQGFKTLITQK